MLICELWSGGQTGVDRAALDVARELGILHRGWIPAGRLAEDGVIGPEYDGLRETESPEYAVRTERNVRDTDATLLLGVGPLEGGTLYTREVAERVARPFLTIDLALGDTEDAARRVREWLAALPGPVRLNVAGPRASRTPSAYRLAVRFLRLVLP